MAFSAYFFLIPSLLLLIRIIYYEKNTVKIYIISLANQAERRKNISKQLTLLGLDYEFIDAIKFENTLGVTDSEVSLSSYGRLLNDGEVGCALSHRNVYNKINNEEIKYALILEDDALIEADILEFLDNVNYMANFDIVILGYSSCY